MKSFLSFVDSKLPYESVAIGKFDALHIAHQRIFKSLISSNLNPCALSILSIKNEYILPPKQRQLLSKIDLYSINFNLIKNLNALDFLKLLVRILPSLKLIVIGYDFCFGKNRQASAKDMQNLLNSLNLSHIKVHILNMQNLKSIPLHTTIIKEFIKYGDICIVNKMLNRFYKIKSRIIKGQGIGKKQLVATINSKSSLYIMPKNGVYATYISVCSKRYESISFIGKRLSTDNLFCIETHILESFSLEPKGFIEIEFVDRIRDNMYFSRLDLLKERISEDINTAKALLKAKKSFVKI